MCYHIGRHPGGEGGMHNTEVIGMMADKNSVSTLLKTARGQIDGILNMVEDDRYCVDISNQIMSVLAVLKKANLEVLTAHCKGCVANARTDDEKDEKIDEMISLLSKLMR